MEKKTNAPDAKAKLSPSLLRKERWKTILVRLYLEGNNHERIRELAKAETGGHVFSRSAVDKAISEAISQWQTDKAAFIDHQKAIELAKINNLENEYWEAWRRSCKHQQTINREKTPVKKEADDQSKTVFSISKITDSKRKTTGDSKFLEGVQWCVEMRCKILGIEAVPKPPEGAGASNTTNVFVRKINFVLKPPVAI